MPAKRHDVSIPAPPGTRADAIVDTVGMFCPVPILRTAEAIRRIDAGAVLEIVSDDRVILVDMPAWCRSTGHRYLGNRGEDGIYHLFVRKSAGDRA